MKEAFRKKHIILRIVNDSFVDLPSPRNINSWWNFGSLLGLCLGGQIISGLFLAIHYLPSVDLAFYSVGHLCRDVEYGWLLRSFHANLASVFFISLYCHVGRGIYYSSFVLREVWGSGVALLILVIMTAFLGYVLPWGQMSFWGATVITNLLSAVPYVGGIIVQWLWGGFAVGGATLTRFFALHFIMPFVIAAIVMVHLILLHETGSNNPLGMKSNMDKIPFHPYYRTRDIVGVVVLMAIMLVWILLEPYYLSDPENFIPANALVTPIHIQPEWYFLFAYAILRAVPNKLGGVIALAASLLILFLLPLVNIGNVKSSYFSFVKQRLFWIHAVVFLLLTWAGACPVEEPFIGVSQVLSFLYFSFYLLWWPAGYAK